MKAASLPTRALSRFGPTVPLLAAADSVWHAPQPLEANSALPSSPAPPAAAVGANRPLAAPPAPPRRTRARSGRGPGRRLAEPAEPGREAGLGLHHGPGAHHRVADAAQLGADDRVGAVAVGRDPVAHP